MSRVLFDKALITYIDDVLSGSRGADDGFYLSITSNLTKKIDNWLFNSHMVGLKKLGPKENEGILLLSGKGISHALNSRMLKENLGVPELVELLDVLFVKGGYSLSKNQSSGDSERR